jgi:ABC-2 type transport system ATP-binding protein
MHLTGVQNVRQEDGHIALNVDEPHRVIPELLAEVERRGWRLAHLTTRQASLEDVFVQLTGRHLREE